MRVLKPEIFSDKGYKHTIESPKSKTSLLGELLLVKGKGREGYGRAVFSFFSSALLPWRIWFGLKHLILNPLSLWGQPRE
jgi:hypothetical protein